MMPEYTLPSGALLAAEHAYGRLSEEERRRPDVVALALLQEAAPFLGPLASQMARRRITTEVSTSIWRDHLKGVSTTALSVAHGVTPKTIRNHVERWTRRDLARLRAGTSINQIARQRGCSTATLFEELHKEMCREQAQFRPGTGTA